MRVVLAAMLAFALSVVTAISATAKCDLNKAVIVLRDNSDRILIRAHPRTGDWRVTRVRRVNGRNVTTSMGDVGGGMTWEQLLRRGYYGLPIARNDFRDASCRRLQRKRARVKRKIRRELRDSSGVPDETGPRRGPIRDHDAMRDVPEGRVEINDDFNDDYCYYHRCW